MPRLEGFYEWGDTKLAEQNQKKTPQINGPIDLGHEAGQST